ncbi:MAG: Na/Pi cotransporter family protein [Thermoguttaceae bacterium]|nr:Na/Pi cotransporter family protein [Thermoguttaceae bacterium]
MSKRRFFIFLLTLFLSALCGTVLFADEADPANPGSESTAVSDAGADWNDDADTDSDDDLKRIEKWIPDQKILIGAPPMVVPLTGVIAQFRREGAFGDEHPIDTKQIKVRVVQNSNKEVVTPVIERNQLCLVWNGTETSRTNIMLEFDYKGNQVYDSFNVEVWEPNFWMMGLVVLGGLGIFMFGMTILSEGVQRIAGPSMRRMIAMFTENRFLAFGTGILATILMQSSSVTTVMTISFVNTQIIRLSQAVGVILGANIGTTITSWLLTLNVSAYALPLVGFSALFFIFVKKERVKDIAAAMMGLGFLFFGLKLMGDGFSSMKELPRFAEFLQSFSADTFWGLVKCVMAGCVVTALIQSSAATIGIVMSLAMIGAVDDFPTAVAFILGENIGTTSTALLASLGTTTNAKRAAAFHAIFNVLGVCWVLAVFRPLFIPAVEQAAGLLKMNLIPFGIPLAHSLFNVTNALLFLPFTKVFADLLVKMIPERKDIPKPTETGLDPRKVTNPNIAVLQSRLIVQRMAERCRKLGEEVFRLIRGPLDNQKEIKHAFGEEEALDRVQDEVIAFTSKILSMNTAPGAATQAREHLRMADEIESVSDYFISILKSALKLKEGGRAIPASVDEGLKQLELKTLFLFRDINRAFDGWESADYFLATIYLTCTELTDELKKLRASFMAEMEKEFYDPVLIAGVNARLEYYRQVWEHVRNIAEAFCGEK